MSQSEYRKSFFLKGGALIYALEKEASRPTLDLDLLAQKIQADHTAIKGIFQELCRIEYPQDGVSFDDSNIETTEIIKEGRYSGIRVNIAIGETKNSLRTTIFKCSTYHEIFGLFITSILGIGKDMNSPDKRTISLKVRF